MLPRINKEGNFTLPPHHLILLRHISHLNYLLFGLPSNFLAITLFLRAILAHERSMYDYVHFTNVTGISG